MSKYKCHNIYHTIGTPSVRFDDWGKLDQSQAQARAERVQACMNALEGFDPAKVRALLDELCGQRIESPSVIINGKNSDYSLFGAECADLSWANKARECREENS